VAEPGTKLIQADVPLLVYPRVVIRVVARNYTERCARKNSCLKTDDRRFKQVSVQNVYLVPAQKPSQAKHSRWILGAATAVTTQALDTLRLHILSQPRRHRIQRSEKHFVAAAVVPAGELWEEAAGVAVLRKMKNPLHKSLVLPQLSVRRAGLLIIGW
jgi:hypothetical protein